MKCKYKEDNLCNHPNICGMWCFKFVPENTCPLGKDKDEKCKFCYNYLKKQNVCPICGKEQNNEHS
jgi:hypothetical protein